MSKTSQYYHFDLWAEFLTVTIAENIAHCQLADNRIKKVRINLSDHAHWPTAFKVILENNLIAPLNDKEANLDASHDIEYLYQCPSNIPFGKNIADPVSKLFIKTAKKHEANFLTDSWSLNNDSSIPALLKQLAFRSVSRILNYQLQSKGIRMSEDFTVQFFDGENYLSFPYDSLRQALIDQIQFYLGNEQIKDVVIKYCFKHSHNQKWFKQLC